MKSEYLIGSGRFLDDRSIFLFQVIDVSQETPKIIKEVSGNSEKEFKKEFLKNLPELKKMNLCQKNYSFSNLYHEEKRGIYSSSIPASLVLFIKRELWENESFFR